jgi:hypothetical protein
MTLISNRKIVLKTTVLMAMAAMLVFAFQGGPPPGYTGYFGEPNCHDCHADRDVDSGGGTFEIRGVPEQYTPGQTYPITVSLGQSGQQRWGFELAARFQGDDTQAGTLQATDTVNTQVMRSDDTGILYIMHTAEGTYAGTQDGPVTWRFNWVAPAEGTDTVVFGAAGNAADGNNKPRCPEGDPSCTGDYIYLTSVSSPPAQ